MTLDERKAAILQAVVEEYVETAQPVGSGRVARTASVAASPATVRNEMVALEADGYLHQPHTSAGRIPTEKGYRFFVDRLEEPTVGLASRESRRVRDFFAQAHGELELVLQRTSHLLSDLTDYTAMVVGPDHEVATVRSVQLVGLAPCTVLVVAVLSDAAVHKRTIELPDDADEARLAVAGAHLASQVVGRTVTDLGELERSGDAAVDAIARIAHDALSAAPEAPDQVYVDGASRMAAAFDAIDTVSEVLQILEQQLIVVSLLRDVLDRGLNVAIGSETGMEPLADCSVVVAPYEVEGEVAGSIGVLGPTRMNYPQALAAVAVVSKRLSRRLSEG